MSEQTTLVKDRIPWFLWLFMGIELCFGILQFAMVSLSNTYLTLYMLLENILAMIHVALVDATIALALYRFYHRKIRHGVALIGFFILSTCVSYFITCLAEGLPTEDMGRLILSSLASVGVHTLLENGLLMIAITAGSFFIFLKKHPITDAPDTLFEKGNPLVPATLSVTCTYTVLHLIEFFIEFTKFGEMYFWIISPGEILTIIADFLFILTGAILAFVVAHISMDKFEYEED